MFKKIIKRNGQRVKFDIDKINQAIIKAGQATGEFDEKIAKRLGSKVLVLAEDLFDKKIPEVEEIQDIVEEVLLNSVYKKTARAFIIYRDQHHHIRELSNMANVGLMDQYLERLDWQVNENSNMTFSLQGLNHYVSSEVSKVYWLNKIYPKEIKQAYLEGDFHIHDLFSLSVYCVGWDLQDLLTVGWGGVSSKIESRPPKRFRSALGQITNFFYTMAGEAAGAQAFSNFDTLLAPFIRYSKLNYEEVKLALQEFMFNMNVPTRVGFQCMSEDTEILTARGWKGHKGVKKNDIIATFNVKSGYIEYLPVKRIFVRQYKGKMYNLKNRISDQLISPEHQVVRRRFSGGDYVLEPIEKVLELKSPFITPIGSLGNVKGQSVLSAAWVKFLAWVVAEGSLDKGKRGAGRISIYQSRETKPGEYEEIKILSEELGLAYSERTQTGLGADCQVLRFDASSTKKILAFFGGDKSGGIKFVPREILSADTETAKLFLETYIKGDGHEKCKITTTSVNIKDDLMMVAANAGYGATVLTRRPDNKLSKKDRYIIRLIKHADTCINDVKQVDYDGVLWCPNTANETVIARRNGKIFITGNTPFTNVTFDLIVPSTFKDQPVIIGGKPQKETYGEFQKEMDMLNKAFFEMVTEGDSKGRVFSWPIPTYNISKDFDWEHKRFNGIWELAAKYGIPYFSNFINSDMKPEDARSMCCRLRIDNRQLEKRGGGLFGANPLTGSVGVVTINLPRIGYLAKSKKDFFERLGKLMALAKDSLEIKRKILEKFTDKNLYPYAKHYLRQIKERRGQYWQNHFSTIGTVGMNEAVLNLLGENIGSEKGRVFASKVLDFMRDKLLEFQKETGHNYNLEATPAEGTSYRLALKDKKQYPKIICASEQDYCKKQAAPYYTNSSQLPVNYTEDIFEALDLQDDLQTQYTGGTVIHLFLGERVDNPQSVKNMVKKICENYRLPYFTFSPTFSVCRSHGYLSGEHFECPKCGEKCEVYARVVGYLSPVRQWHEGKQEEFKNRKVFKMPSLPC